MSTTTQKSKKNSTTSAPKCKQDKGATMPEQQSNDSSEQTFESPVQQSNPTLLATSDEVFTIEQVNIFDRACHIIDDAQARSEGLAEAIASQLYRIDASALYKIRGYTSMKSFASERFGISAGTCSDSINTYKRFGILQGADGIRDEYKDYKFSTLMLIKKLSDSDIERVGINPTMGRSDIKMALEHLKELQIEDKQKKAVIEHINLLIENIILHIPAEEFANELTDRFGDAVKSIITMELEQVKEVEAYVVSRLREVDPNNSNLPDLEELEEESSTAEPEEESSTAEPNETPNSMPTKTVNIAGKSKEDVLKELEALLDGVSSGEYDICITSLV